MVGTTADVVRVVVVALEVRIEVVVELVRLRVVVANELVRLIVVETVVESVVESVVEDEDLVVLEELDTLPPAGPLT